MFPPHRPWLQSHASIAWWVGGRGGSGHRAKRSQGWAGAQGQHHRHNRGSEPRSSCPAHEAFGRPTLLSLVLTGLAGAGGRGRVHPTIFPVGPHRPWRDPQDSALCSSRHRCGDSLRGPTFVAVQLRCCCGDEHHLQQPGALRDVRHVRWAASRCPPPHPGMLGHMQC